MCTLKRYKFPFVRMFSQKKRITKLKPALFKPSTSCSVFTLTPSIDRLGQKTLWSPQGDYFSMLALISSHLSGFRIAEKDFKGRANFQKVFNS